MTVFERYRNPPQMAVDYATGEVVEPSARLVVSDTLMAIDGLFKELLPDGSKPAEEEEGDIFAEAGKHLSTDWFDYNEDIDKAKRGRIQDFSRASQARLMKRLACWEAVGDLHIVTLTYPRLFPATSRAQADFHRFRQMLMRCWPSLAGLWKLEYQARGAPHFHLVLQTGDEAVDLAGFRRWLDEAWQRARQSTLPARTQCQPARDQDRARFYLAKEAGKSLQTAGRHLDVWKDRGAEIVHTGRFWGWHHKKALRFAAKVVEVSAEVAWRFRRRVQELVGAVLVAKGALRFDSDGLMVRRDGKAFDQAALPTWQLCRQAGVTAARIIADLRADGVDLPALEDWPRVLDPF